jgi:hypothetical protein
VLRFRDRKKLGHSEHVLMGSSRELFRAYLDESEDSSSGIYAVGGFVGHAEVWDSLEPQWLSDLPSGVTLFHATDCFTGNNEFAGVSIADRVAVLNRLTNVIAAHDVWLVGYGIDAKTYQKLAPKAKENEFLRNKYAGRLVELWSLPVTPWEISQPRRLSGRFWTEANSRNGVLSSLKATNTVRAPIGQLEK